MPPAAAANAPSNHGQIKRLRAGPREIADAAGSNVGEGAVTDLTISGGCGDLSGAASGTR